MLCVVCLSPGKLCKWLMLESVYQGKWKKSLSRTSILFRFFLIFLLCLDSLSHYFFRSVFYFSFYCFFLCLLTFLYLMLLSPYVILYLSLSSRLALFLLSLVLSFLCIFQLFLFPTPSQSSNSFRSSRLFFFVLITSVHFSVSPAL